MLLAPATPLLEVNNDITLISETFPYPINLSICHSKGCMLLPLLMGRKTDYRVHMLTGGFPLRSLDLLASV